MHSSVNPLQEGLWSNNPVLVQMLGLCPLLAVSNTLRTSMGLAIATLFVITLASLFVSLIRAWTPNHLRLPMFVIIIAALVTAAELLVQAYSPSLHQSLGIFLPLIVTNCMILGRMEAHSSKQPVLEATWAGFAYGLGFAWVVLVMGSSREMLATGAVSFDAVGSVTHFLLPALPAGAFMLLGVLLACMNWLEKRSAESSAHQQ